MELIDRKYYRRGIIPNLKVWYIMKNVELICDNSVMDSIIDRFGQDVTTYANDMTSFRVIVNVATSHVFYSWVFGFGGLVKIKAPQDVKDKYEEMLKASLENPN